MARGGGGANARSSYRGSVEPEVETGTLQKHALYIFCEKSQVKVVNVEKFPKADFIPVEFPEPKHCEPHSESYCVPVSCPLCNRRENSPFTNR